MEDLLHQRCFNHLRREAVARCPECRRKRAIGALENYGHFAEVTLLLTRVIHLLLGGMFLWIFFYYLGQVLLSLPSSFHEGTLWEMEWWKPQ